MKLFAKLIFNKKGLTLIEVLASLTIVTLILGSAYGLFASGINIYNKINGDIRLRDEADIIITNIMNELYKNPINNIIKCTDDAGNPIDNCIKIYNTETMKIAVGQSDSGVDIASKNELKNSKKLKILKVVGSEIQILYQIIDASGNEVNDPAYTQNPIILNGDNINVEDSTITADCKYMAGIYKNPSDNNAEITTKCVNALMEINLSVKLNDSNSMSNPLVLNSQFGL